MLHQYDHSLIPGDTTTPNHPSNQMGGGIGASRSSRHAGYICTSVLYCLFCIADVAVIITLIVLFHDNIGIMCGCLLLLIFLLIIIIAWSVSCRKHKAMMRSRPLLPQNTQSSSTSNTTSENNQGTQPQPETLGTDNPPPSSDESAYLLSPNASS